MKTPRTFRPHGDAEPWLRGPAVERSPRDESGVALVVTVIVVAMLALVAVALMQSTTADRAASRSAGNYYRAQLAAESGANMAMAQVSSLISEFPDSVTVWQNIGGDSSNEATVLYMRARGNDPLQGALPAMFGDQVTIVAQPLVSGVTNSVPLGSIGSVLRFEDGPEMIDLNATDESRPHPWIGARVLNPPNNSFPLGAGNSGPVTAARWIDVQALPGPASSTNPVIARFAYWVEDESFKLNVNYSTNGPRGQLSLGTDFGELSIDGTFVDIRAFDSAQFGEMLRARLGMPGSNFPTTSTAAIPLQLGASNAATLRFMTTSASAGLDLSRGGVRRFNINSITNNISGPEDRVDIRRSLSRIIAAITNTNAAPLFGQRFYRQGGTEETDVNATNFVEVSDRANANNHALIYLNKIAANLLDYVDTDSQPTTLRSEDGFPVQTGTPDLAAADPPIFNEGVGGEGPNQFTAVGTEVRPYLFGYGLGVNLSKMTPEGYKSSEEGSGGGSATFEFSADHFFDFWNPGQKDIVVGSGTSGPDVTYLPDLFIQILDAAQWDPTVGGVSDIKAKFPDGTRFPAGAVTLVTTASLDDALKFAPTAANVVSINGEIAESARRFTGTTTKSRKLQSINFPNFDTFYIVELDSRAPVSTSLDYSTQVLLGNSNGIVEMFPALTLGSMRLWMSNTDSTLFTNKSALFGTKVAEEAFSVSGDARSLNEPLVVMPYAPGSGENPNQYRFFTSATRPLGVPNTTYADPSKWPDFSSFSAGAVNAPLVVADSALRSIGELGHLADPARAPALSGSLSSQIYSRGGGRTLRIGQPELPAWYDGSQTNASRTWASWRLADIFTTKTNLILPGLINPNGALRDNGAAFRAMLNEFTFLDSPVGAPETDGNTLDYDNGTAMVTNAIFRMTNVTDPNLRGSLNPFWERGEISELSVFNTGDDFSGGDMASTFDRGREEFTRRSIELITTRGSIFSVYVVGQALKVTGNTTNVLSTARLKTTFQMIPQFSQSATNDSFDPESSSAISARFQSPTNYSVRILSSSYE